MSVLEASGIVIFIALALVLPSPADADAEADSEVRPTQTTDTEPAPIAFAPINNANSSKYYDSKPATITAINAPSPISVKGGLYKINGGPYTEQAGTVHLNDQVSLLVRASSRSARSVLATLTVGSVSASFTVTTGGALDTVPDNFTFAAVNDAKPGVTYMSKPTIITGITARTQINVTGGLYRINNGSFSSLAGTVNAGDLVYVELSASNIAGTSTVAQITVGGVSGSFSVTTAATDPVGH